MQPAHTRHSLIIRLKGDLDEAAWEQFVAQYESFLQHLALRQGVPETSIPDVIQQVLMAVARSIEGWQADGQSASFRRWLSTVARNVAIKFMTRERRHLSPLGSTELLELLQNVPDQTEPQMLQQYEYELVLWAAQQVRHEFIATSWQAFQATVIEQRPVAEVAAELNLSAGSIYMSRSRIINRIRQRVESVLQEDDA